MIGFFKKRKRRGKMAMISLPMRGKTESEIAAKFNDVSLKLEEMGYDTAYSWFDFDEKKLLAGGVKELGVYYLAKSIEAMAYCDVVYFCKGWMGARGCRIEHSVAKSYGIEIIYEE